MNDEIKEILFLLHNDRLSESGKRKLEDYITNLQQENNNLKTSLDESQEVVIDLQQENERLELLNDELELYNIIKKAFEYIKEHQRKDEFLNLNEWQTRDLLNILNGRSDE